ncbi:MAG: alkane 1-monooxygenase [Myxococcota bacterium]|jgi:alkane 1-monooxygenase
MNALPYLVAYVLPISFFAGLALGGAWMLLPVFVAFGLIPLLDPFVGRDESDPAEADAENPAFDLVLKGWIPAQLAVFGAALWWIAAGGGTTLEWFAITLSTGVVAVGGGINVAHELMHRRGAVDRALAELLMTMTTYTHFCVEHVLGHHKNVATPNDPASSRLGESVYTFIPRSVVGGLVSAWRLEAARTGRRNIPWTSLSDRRTRGVLQVGGAYALVFAAAGVPGVLWFGAQSAIAIVLLEVINYVEHYGLSRAEVAPGRYERVQPHHSWNATQRLTNWFLFNLPRHADHHAWAHRRYNELRAWPDAPSMPYGYPTMVLIALVPPLWFMVMNPRVAAVRRAEQAA